MLTPSRCFVVLIGPVCFACAGCAPGLTAIPTGQWTGTGSFVDYQAISRDGGKPEVQAAGRCYATSLRITKGDLYGRHVLFFDILSKRGRLMNVEGEESHVTFILVEADALADGTTLHAIVDFQFNPSSPRQISQDEFGKESQIATAVCFRRGRGIVLQVNYSLPTVNDPVCFWDTFTFEGDTVRKTGRVVQVKDESPGREKVASVDWTEELRKTR